MAIVDLSQGACSADDCLRPPCSCAAAPSPACRDCHNPSQPRQSLIGTHPAHKCKLSCPRVPFLLAARHGTCHGRCSSESILPQSGWRTQTCPATYCGNLVPARTPMTADPANHPFSDKSRLENSSSEIARHFVPVLMLRPGRRSRAQNSAYQPPAAPLSCAVFLVTTVWH
jgi:hypothetical protein